MLGPDAYDLAITACATAGCKAIGKDSVDFIDEIRVIRLFDFVDYRVGIDARFIRAALEEARSHRALDDEMDLIDTDPFRGDQQLKHYVIASGAIIIDAKGRQRYPRLR